MTLCYETDAEDGLTDIFIDDIHPEGLAAQDGRLRLGDQIIQINGVDVKTKTQAQEIFVTSSGDISFLVARPPCHDQYTCHLDEDSCDLDFQVSLTFFSPFCNNFPVENLKFFPQKNWTETAEQIDCLTTKLYTFSLIAAIFLCFSN